MSNLKLVSKPNKIMTQQYCKGETTLLNIIRRSLCNGSKIVTVPSDLTFQFDPKISHIFISLFQEKLKPIRWGSKKKDLASTLNRIINKLRTNDRFESFSVSDSKTCRILIEVVTEKTPCKPTDTTIFGLTDDRLEPGIHGLMLNYQDQTIYYMPTDAYVNSLMTMKQVYNHLAKRTGIASKTQSIQERASLVRRLPVQFMKIKSLAFITYKENALLLYRGIPTPPLISRTVLYECIEKGADWLVANQNEDGKFLYFYDASIDSTQDFQHPRTDYYNILRHAGGTITLLKAFQQTNKKSFLNAAKLSLYFTQSTFRYHSVKSKEACFPFFNEKSKLGGAGITLVAFMQYVRLTKDYSFNREIHGLTRHILSRVSDDGEMTGYFIHPLYNNGEPLHTLSEKLKEKLFSFYYPGEALLGLVLYLKYTEDIDHKYQAEIMKTCTKAFDFLVEKRPVKYNHLFQTLPSDGWLMQAIEEWIKIGGEPKQTYVDFVYNDAEAMISHMYKPDNSPFADYPGMFFYSYGEHAYPDAARCEGLIAAYSLANHLKDEEKAKRYLQFLKLAAQAILRTYNSEEASYPHKKPSKSIGSYRFKLTRQWVRVDSSQHAICFFTRLINYL